MARYRTIQMDFWTDRAIIDDFTPEDRYFYLYLLTNPHTNLAGCYEFSFKQAAVELGYDMTSVMPLIKRFEGTHDILRYSEATKEVLLINWHRYNWTSSEKFRAHLKQQIEQVKDLNFKDYLLALFNCEDTVSIPYPYGMDTSVTVTVNNTSINNPINNTINNTKKSKSNKKKGDLHSNPELRPTVEQIREYVAEKGFNIDAYHFFDYYNEAEWLDRDGKPVRSWKQRLISWSGTRNDIGRGNQECGGTRTGNGSGESGLRTDEDEWQFYVPAQTF